jgi:group I intron endonuclease
MKGIYIIKNIKTGKVYVGSSVKLEAREQRHFKNLIDGNHHSNKLQNSYNKYGKDYFIFEPIEEYEEIDNEILIEREQHWIDFYDSYNGGYNCRPKAENNYGHKHSEETKELMSRIHGGKNNAMYGRNLSQEHKEKIRQKMLNRFVSEETRKKLRDCGINRKHSEETKLKQSRIKKSKPILQLDDNFKIIKEWYSKREPLRDLGVRVDYTVKSENKYSRGFYWVYKSEYDSFIKKKNVSF